ncbi:polysaccharide deacetylase family protein [Chryseobacterium sp. SNU WT5]|uniref:polysaccharide deacetylase family protein n=1 Tax=Chryseobacterium sp. SNU WT5 TaxID=2594269 RepID=UPI001180F5EE|nr:polysaccharide deacetylase family protein [Chryseobacterium sp. SNU WT5]QDP84077.1 polysaccharide deacetylase family protein [Chryseobacterium sp. SNU WT5]
MSVQFYNNVSWLTKIIPLDQFLRQSGQKMILPFYHTVSDLPAPHFSELGYYRDQEMFIKDLDFFQGNFESIDLHDFGDSKKAFHLSFDDGLSENFSLVAKLLNERKIHATFFINLDFIDNKKMFIRHKISLILHQLNHSESNLRVASEYMKCEEIDLEGKVKKILEEKKVDELAALLQINFSDYLMEQRPYLSTAELKEMKKMGFNIGNHSLSHPRFSTLAFKNQKIEVQQVNNFLKNELLAEDLYFCFPYGDDRVENQFFEWLCSEGEILKSFGTAGLKKDHFPNHFHRILMEYPHLTAQQIIKGEYMYYFAKAFLNKNKIRR